MKATKSKVNFDCPNLFQTTVLHIPRMILLSAVLFLMLFSAINNYKTLIAAVQFIEQILVPRVSENNSGARFILS